MTVEGIIGDLLLQHNCVIVPTFGGFVAQRVGAQMDVAKGVLLPPRKSVLFNRQLINNDGLLVSSYAQQNKVDYAAAQSAINDAVAGWDLSLKQGQRISIDRVGFLYFDQERNLCFEQDRFYNLLMESYGLGSIHFVSAADVEAKTAHTAIQELVKEAIDAPTPIVEFRPAEIEAVPQTAAEKDTAVISIAARQSVATKKPVRVWKYVAAAALIPIAFYSFWIPMKTDVLESGILSLQDFNPFHRVMPGTYIPSTEKYTPQIRQQKHQLDNIPGGVSVFSYSLDDTAFIPVRVSGNGSPEVVEATPPQPEPEIIIPTPEVKTPVKSSGGSFVIVGSFSDAANAQLLVADLKSKGYDARILEGKGSVRVSAGDGNQFAALSKKLQAEGLSAWLLK